MAADVAEAKVAATEAAEGKDKGADAPRHPVQCARMRHELTEEDGWAHPNEQTNEPRERKIIMPGGNGTGPAGMGPMTGRGAGFCAGYGVPGYANPTPGGFGYGRGGGFGRGGGRGFGMGFRGGRWAGPAYAPAYPVATAAPVPQNEMDALKVQADYLAKTLDGVQKRILELETESTDK